MTWAEFCRRRDLTDEEYYRQFIEGGWSGLEFQEDYLRKLKLTLFF